MPCELGTDLDMEDNVKLRYFAVLNFNNQHYYMIELITINKVIITLKIGLLCATPIALSWSLAAS